jgi:hypothetical protein
MLLQAFYGIRADSRLEMHPTQCLPRGAGPDEHDGTCPKIGSASRVVHCRKSAAIWGTPAVMSGSSWRQPLTQSGPSVG